MFLPGAIVRGGAVTAPRISPTLLLTLLANAILIPPTSRAQEDDESRDRRPGLIATYQAPAGEKKIVVERAGELPALMLRPGEAPDPRLPPQNWSAAWRGYLEIRLPGKHRFFARSSGDLEIRINGQPALSGAANPQADLAGTTVALEFGRQPIEVRFTQRGEGAELKLFWESEDFSREPLPEFVPVHLESQRPAADLFARGRLAVEEHSCTSCHLPGGESPMSHAVVKRPGPRLSDAGGRLNAAWIYDWLGDPHAFRPEAVMPRLFSTDRQGDVERFAVATFLAARGKAPEPRKLNDGQLRNWPKEGQALFESTGCVVCHERQETRAPRATLQRLAGKLSVGALAAFLQNPAAVDPGGRMPAFQFRNADDAWKIALYLHERDREQAGPARWPGDIDAAAVRNAFRALSPAGDDAARFEKASADEQIALLARRVMRQKRCTACHELNVPSEADFWKPLPAQHTFAEIAVKPDGGCLNERPAGNDRSVPAYGPSLDRAAAVSFLNAAVTAPGTPAPGELARLTIERFHCTGCHVRHGGGGLPPSLIEKMLVNQSAEHAESLLPPPLTGISTKLLARSIRDVLQGSQRSRPWMGLQMPRFDMQYVGHLPTSLAALDGEAIRDEPYRPAADQQLIEAGRTLVGDKGFSCTKCHDMLGIASTGTRGPDLARIAERVTYEWYRRWMTDPQRMQPGTRMPTVFYGSKSPYDTILGGDPEKQRLAMWQYLLVCRSLPFPDGLKPPQKLRFPESNITQVVRTFLPETSARGIAIRNPNGIHLAFDAQACRLSYGWTGEFLDMRPVWDGRGGNKAGIDGAIFWSAPAGFPWEVTPSSEPVPDLSGRGTDTTLGAITPQDGQLHPSRLNFRTYRTLGDRTSFEYDLELGQERSSRFTETVATFREGLTTGVSRDVAIVAPAGSIVWLHAAMLDQPPEWEAAASQRGTLDADNKAAPANAVLSGIQDSRRFALHLRGSSPGVEWLSVKRGDRWSLVLRLPTAGDPAQAKLHLVLLKPIDDQEPTTKKVVAEELTR